MNRPEEAECLPGRPAGRVSGLILLRKPSGITSFQALGPVKRKLGTGKVGHAGTLDKFASGLLVLLSGSYSRLNEFVSAGAKLYRGKIGFGAETSTLDPEGAIVAEAPPPTREVLEAVLPSFRGRIMQRPPAYSALHLDGKRAYERALAGEELEMAERPVDIHSLELEDFGGNEATILVRCGAGTYIRSLARDMALACGSRASLLALERLAIGPFSLEASVAPEDFNPARDLGAFSRETAAGLGLGILGLGERDASRFRNGGLLTALAFEPCPEKLPAAVFGPDGAFLGIVQGSGSSLAYRLVIGEGA